MNQQPGQPPTGATPSGPYGPPQQPWPPQAPQPHPGQGVPQAQPGQSYPQPYPGQPYSQPYPGQPYPGQQAFPQTPAGYPQSYGAPAYAPQPQPASPAGRRPRRPLTKIAVALAALLVLALVVGAGIVVYRAMFPVHRAAEALPNDCTAYAELNLAPRPDQWVGLGAFVGNLQPPVDWNGRPVPEQVKPTINPSTPKKAVVEWLVRDALGVPRFSYDEVEPWLGDRIGGCVTDRAAYLAVATPRPTEAAAGLQRLLARSTQVGSYELQAIPLERFVLIGPGERVSGVAAQVRYGQSLASTTAFAADAGALDEGALLTGWFGPGATRQFLADSAAGLGNLHAGGAMTFTAEAATLDLSFAGLPGGRAIDGNALELADGLPATSQILGATSAPAGVAALVDAAAGTGRNREGFDGFFRRMGVSFPADTETYLGQGAAAAAEIDPNRGGEATYGVVVKTADSRALAERLAAGLERCCYWPQRIAVISGQRAAVASDGAFATTMAEGSGRLGEQELFRRAVDRRDPAFVFYQDFTQPTYLGIAEVVSLQKRIRALGIAGSAKADGTGRASIRWVA